jgi:hypothetical protein
MNSFIPEFSKNRLVSIFMLLSILFISLIMSAYIPVLEGIDETASALPSAGGATAPITGGTTAPSASTTTGGETDLNKVIAIINANTNKPSITTEKQAIAGIVLNDKYTEQTIDATELKNLLKNSKTVKDIMNPILPPSQ